MTVQQTDAFLPNVGLIKTSQGRHSLISDNQCPYVDENFISEGGSLIKNVFQTIDVLKLSGTLVTIDIQKTFNTVSHQFVTSALKRYGFGKTSIKTIKTLLNKQKLCIING